MRILSKIKKLIPLTATTGTVALVSPAIAAAVAAKELPELLASNDDTEIGDNYTKTTPENDNKTTNDNFVKSKSEIKQTKLGIYKKYEVSKWKRFCYAVGDFFNDRDIISAIKDEIQKDLRSISDVTDPDKKRVLKAYSRSVLENPKSMFETNDTQKELYALYARRYIKNIIGDTEGKSPEEIEAAYKRAEQEFALQITHVSEKDRALFDSVMPAVLAEMKADRRAGMAEDFVQTAVTRNDELMKLNGLVDNAEVIVLTEDANGDVPSQCDAMDFFGVIVKRADENVDIKLQSTVENFSCKVDIGKCQKLQRRKESGEALSREEERELTRYKNTVLAPNASRAMHLPGNEHLSPDYRNKALSSLGIKLKEQGIVGDVLKAVEKYLETSPNADEILSKVYNVSGRALAEILDEVTDGEYSRICSENGGKGYTSSLSRGDEKTGNNKGNSAEAGANKEAIKDTTDNSRTTEDSTTSERRSRTFNSGQNPFGSASSYRSYINGNKSSGGQASVNTYSSDYPSEKANKTFTSRPTVLNSYQEGKKYIKNAESAKSIITGKVRLRDRSCENLVLEQYKIMSTEEQGTTLAEASDKWYRKLKGYTRNKYAAISACLNSGKKGKNFDRTKDMHDTLKEENKKLTA